MKNRRSLLYLGLASFLVTILFIYSTMAQQVKTQPADMGESRADVVIIDAMKVFGNLERPEVLYLHGQHTDALEKKSKDCLTCHLKTESYKGSADEYALSPKFKRLEDKNKQEVMDIYHNECQACHKETADAGEKSGPVEACGECHKEKLTVVSSRQPMGFDKSLHFRHSEATKLQGTDEESCNLCHHEYDEDAKKLFYAKEKEGSCRYCHKAVAEENRISFRLASHLGCIKCHQDTLAQNKTSGPIKCMDCHDLKKQQEIKKAENIRRIDRKQPDVVLIRPQVEQEGLEPSVIRMNPVPFSHKAHEEKSETCIACHHASLNSCTKTCHTVEGSEDGKNVKLETAMHQFDSNHSCIGCHKTTQKEKECAGCHTFMEKASSLADTTCTKCHMKTPEMDPAADLAPEVMASVLLDSRKAATISLREEDIPEKVVIKSLSDKYEPVDFPHRKIVYALADAVKEDKLAQYFHTDMTLCQGCHHNSPAAPKPPSCGSCHGKPFDEKNPMRPGLKGAYHQQCMGCHAEMALEKPKAVECTECHKTKKKPEKAFFGRPL